jgi:hypothetical protein
VDVGGPHRVDGQGPRPRAAVSFALGTGFVLAHWFAWSCAGVLRWCIQLADSHLSLGRCCVAAGWVLWATEVSTLTVIMAWTSAKLSPDAESAAAVLSALLLFCVSVLAAIEAVIYALRNPAAQATDGPSADEFRGLSNWLTERL